MANVQPEGCATSNHGTLPDACAVIDQGGGVGYKGLFLIFTRQHVSLYVPQPLCYPSALIDLSAAADRISNKLRIYLNFDHFRKEDLFSLTCQPNRARDINLPWFFLNASAQDPRKFGIAGQGTVLDALTSILRRPWCVLELCCTDTEIIKAFVEFLELVCKVQEKEFAAARQILSYEITCRASIQRSVFAAPLTGSKISNSHVTGIQDLYVVLSAATEQSFKGHWIRAICVCAARFSLSISMFGSLIGYTEMMRASTAPNGTFWERILFRQLGKDWSSPPSRAERALAESQKFLTSSFVDILIARSLLPLYSIVLGEIADYVN